MLKHYVEFDTPGALFPETEMREVKTRIPSHLKNIPEGTYAIEYHSREEINKDGEILMGKVKNKSKRIVFGKVYTLEDIKKDGFDEHSHLYRNASNSDDNKLVKCIMGNWQPYYEDWIILANYEELKTLKDAI